MVKSPYESMDYVTMRVGDADHDRRNRVSRLGRRVVVEDPHSGRARFGLRGKSELYVGRAATARWNGLFLDGRPIN